MTHRLRRAVLTVTLAVLLGGVGLAASSALSTSPEEAIVDRVMQRLDTSEPATQGGHCVPETVIDDYGLPVVIRDC